jgi:outer membrane lipoprotein-sorting protein
MNSPKVKLSMAAAVVLLAVLCVLFWQGTGAGIALADVLAQIEKVEAFRCQWSSDGTIEGPNKPYSQKKRGGGTFVTSQEYGTKTIIEELDPNGTKSTFEVCILPDKRTQISISHKQKKYWRTERPEFDARAAAKRSSYDPRTLINRILELKHESLGRSTIDGIEVEGFRTTDPNYYLERWKNPQIDIKAWVDAKTRLPVRYDLLGSVETDGMGNRMVTHMVMSNFQWDVPVDASEFKPVIPDDYTGTVVKYPAHLTEETAIEGLKLWGELLNNYPGKITNVDGIVLQLAKKSETPAALRLRKETAALTDEEALNKLVDFLIPLRGLAGFYDVLKEDKKDPAYYGETVTPKDTDKVLLRWKVSDKEYRVIFGDLHAETVSPERLAELEKALPK